MRINLTDNNIGQVKAGIFLRKDVSALFPIADKTIAQLCHENENLLVFPFSIEDSDDKVGEASVKMCIRDRTRIFRKWKTNIVW